MTRLAIFLGVIAAVISIAGRLGADDSFPHIYRVATTRKDAKPIELSGFKVRGRNGLYTALHGVVGYRTIRAFQHEGKSTGYEMKIAEVDVERDVAYLLPVDEGVELPGGGLALGYPPDLDGLVDRPVKVYGYSMGVDELASSMPLTISDPAVSMLSQRCPAYAKPELNDRASPALNIRVLRLDGNLLPGHSGAAVLDAERAVVAIADGGLDNGRVGVGWAIPFQDIKLIAYTDATIVDTLERLEKAPVNYKLFCVLNDDARKWFKHVRITTSTVIVSKDGDPVLASKMTPKQAIGEYFQLLRETLQGKDRYEQARALHSGNTVQLANGTAIEVKEVARTDGDGVTAPAFPFPVIPRGGNADDPLGGLEKALSASAEGVNVRVKVLDGPHKGKDLWVFSGFLRRESTISEEK